MDHAEEAVGQLIVAGGDGAIDLEVTEHALDAVALLVECCATSIANPCGNHLSKAQFRASMVTWKC